MRYSLALPSFVLHAFLNKHTFKQAARQRVDTYGSKHEAIDIEDLMLALDALKTKALKHLSFLTGTATASTKSVLITQLRHHLDQDGSSKPSMRVVSIDMGIKNLALCVMNSSPSKKHTLALHVDVWKKLNLLDQLQGGVDNNKITDDAGPVMDEPAIVNGIFSPQNVSKLAYEVSMAVLTYKPDVILIEQQRFRSGGGSAIQEWTVRVNMLESMLWACLETLRQQQKQPFPETYSVSPARMARFWFLGKTMSLTAEDGLIGSDAPEVEGSGRLKVTKKDRMSILQGWVQKEKGSHVDLDFSDEAQALANRFKSSSRAADNASIGKLDDLTDCLMQGAAWLKWEDNRQRIKAMIDRAST